MISTFYACYDSMQGVSVHDRGCKKGKSQRVWRKASLVVEQRFLATSGHGLTTRSAHESNVMEQPDKASRVE